MSSDWLSNQFPVGSGSLQSTIVVSRRRRSVPVMVVAMAGGASGSLNWRGTLPLSSGKNHLRIERTRGTRPHRGRPRLSWSPVANTPPPLAMKVASA